MNSHRTLTRLKQQYHDLEVDRYDRICSAQYELSSAKLAMRNVKGTVRDVTTYVNEATRGKVKECGKIGETSFEYVSFWFGKG